ncbi:MAG: YtxH domain-containing protein [Melioribacteraceae bacterium]
MIHNFNKVKSFLVGFFAGGTVAAIATLLTAPKSGKEFRSDIKQKSEEYFEEAEKYLAEVKNKADDLVYDSKKNIQ